MARESAVAQNLRHGQLFAETSTMKNGGREEEPKQGTSMSTDLNVRHT